MNLNILIADLIDSINNNKKVRKIGIVAAGNPFKENYVARSEMEFNCHYPKLYKKYLLSISGAIKLEWELEEQISVALNLNSEYTFARGKVETLGPSAMTGGKNGDCWKGIFWFDEIKSDLNDRLKRFVPFDLSDGFNYVTGFMKEGNDKDGWVIGDQLYLNIENEELIPHPFTFEEYLEFIVKSKGYLNLMGYYNKPDSEQFKRFMRIMPKIFDDFDTPYFIELGRKK